MSLTTNKYVSDELFHFVGFNDPTNHERNYETLIAILDSGRVLYKGCNPHETGQRITINWDADIVKGELVVPQVTCFCDIPEAALSIHKLKYGLFGIGFTRSYMVGKGARPVIYVPTQPRDYRSGWGSIHGVMAIEDWKTSWDAFYEYVVTPNSERVMSRTLNVRPKSAQESIMAIENIVTKDFFAFLKAFDCDLPEDEITNYYMEREWRLIGHLSFLKSELSSVFVPKAFEQRLISDRPNYQANIKISDG